MISELKVKQLINLAKERKETYIVYQEKYEPDIKELILPEKYAETEEYKKRAEADEALEEYLHALNKDELIDLITIMYIGREIFCNGLGCANSEEQLFDEEFEDDEPDIIENWNFDEERENNVRTGYYEDEKAVANQIYEKSPLDDYLELGLKAIKTNA